MLYWRMDAASIIRTAREETGITQAELAQRTGTTQSAISRLERGHSRPSLSTIRRLVRACGLELQVTVRPGAPAPEPLDSTLALSPSERLDQLVRTVAFVRAGREAMGIHAG